MSEAVDSRTDAAGPTSSRADTAGAVLVVVAVLGVVGWVWRILVTQVDQDPGSFGERISAFVGLAPVLLLAAAVGGIGIGLRHLAALQTGRPSKATFARPAGRIALGLAALVAMLIGGFAIAESRHRTELVLSNQHFLNDVRLRELVTTNTLNRAATPTASSHTLEVHTDGCGVFRTGTLGERLTWVVKDQDGFQVLGRNAAGETQYRFFRPGTYTVVLEAWGASHYVEVSNEVEISC